jgi:hypothetical protein
VSGHRQAAVALHGLDAEDRASILAELPPADQHTLRSFLDELDALGFDREAVAAVGKSASAAPARSGADPHGHLHGASAAAMFALLEPEPSALIAQVLNLRDWPWAGELVHLFPAPRRESIRAARALYTVPAPSRTRFLLETLSARVSDVAVPATDDGGRNPLRALRTRIAAWTR